MSTKSLSKGGLYYLVYNILNLAFPFLTGIYVSRVLLPESIGTVTAAQNVAQYFVILAFLGIPTYGLREIAKTRNNYDERSKVYSELFVINLISTAFFLCLYIALIILVTSYREQLVLYLTIGISITLNAFNISWLYEGLEEFKFVSVRNLLFKIVSFVFLVLFVRSQSDVLIYALVTVVGTAGNYIVNMIYAPKFVRFGVRNLNLRRHLKPIFYLVAVNLAIELYSLVDITMMNFFCSKENIAYYKYAQSIERMLLQVVNTFTMVFVPRIAFYYKEAKTKEFNQLITKALKLIIIVSVPMIIGLQFTSDFFLVKLYGDSYIASSSILKMLCLLLFISPIGYLLGSRILLVTGHENRMIISVGVGALINVIGNSLLIPVYKGFGAAIASVFSEIIVMIVYVKLGWSYYKLDEMKSTILRAAASNLTMCAFLIVCTRFSAGEYLLVTIEVLGSIVVYCCSLVLFKEQIALEYCSKLLRRIAHK